MSARNKVRGDDILRDAPAEGDAPEKSEWELRRELAAAYRMFDHFGWTQIIYGHLTARVPGPEKHFLINPFGLMYHEVTASNLVKIDIDGNIIGHSDYSVNPAGWVIHGAIHDARDDAHCIMHQHTTGGMAVAAMEEGLQHNDFFAIATYGRVAYHDFEGVTFYTDERDRLSANLGDADYMILRNHGLLTCGRTVAEAFNRYYLLESACLAQWRAQSSGAALVTPPREVCEKHARDMDAGQRGDMAFNALVRLMEQKDPTFLQ